MKVIRREGKIIIFEPDRKSALKKFYFEEDKAIIIKLAS